MTLPTLTGGGGISGRIDPGGPAAKVYLSADFRVLR